MNKKALITGANSLVDKVIMVKLIDMGYSVTAHYHTEDEITHDLKNKYPGVDYVQADFAFEQDANSFIKTVQAKGPFDVLINGAAIFTEAGEDWPEVQKSWRSWTDNFSVNITVPGLLLSVADKLINKGGVVINISSAMGQIQFGDPQFNMYGASKAALDFITCTYAKRWSPDIRVVGLAPAYIHSEWNIDLPQEEKDKLALAHLTHKLIEPEEIADLIAAVILNPSINATTILIDGGYLK